MNATVAGCRFHINGIADELKLLPRWVRFDLAPTSRGKLRKTPYIPGTLCEASNQNSAHWRSFEVAVADALVRGQYLGFVFDRSLPYVFIDKDDALGANGVMRVGAARIVDTLRGCTERSASGVGLHIIVRGSLPERIAVADEFKPIEVYPRRGPRYCVFTGALLPVEGNLEGAIPERSEELVALFPARSEHATGCVAGSADGPRGELTDEEFEAIIAWAGPFWIDGRRHHMALYLSGELARRGVSREQAVAIIHTCAAHDHDPDAKVSACEDTFDEIEAGETVSGWCGLRDACGISEEDLSSLSAILDGFWRRSAPRIIRVRRAPSLRMREATHA